MQSAPELARLLGEDIDGEPTGLFEQHKTGTSNRGPGYSVQGSKGAGSHAVSPDNPALAAEEELTEEDELVCSLLCLCKLSSKWTFWPATIPPACSTFWPKLPHRLAYML